MCLSPLVLPFQLALGEPTTRLGTGLVLDVPALDADLKLLKASMLLEHLLELLSWAGPPREFLLVGPGLTVNFLVLLLHQMGLKPNWHPPGMWWGNAPRFKIETKHCQQGLSIVARLQGCTSRSHPPSA